MVLGVLGILGFLRVFLVGCFLDVCWFGLLWIGVEVVFWIEGVDVVVCCWVVCCGGVVGLVGVGEGEVDFLMFVGLILVVWVDLVDVLLGFFGFLEFFLVLLFLLVSNCLSFLIVFLFVLRLLIKIFFVL